MALLAGDGTQGDILGPRPWMFIATVVFLGVCASWIGIVLWSLMSQRLTPALGGQMIIFETIFAVTYAHLWRSEWPTPLMLVGLGLLLMGVTASLKVFRKPRRTASGTT